jgi:hypothetical protein
MGWGTTVLCEWAIARKGLASLYERRDNLADQQAAHAKQLEDLYAEIGRLTTQLNWLKKTSPAVSGIPPREKRSCAPGKRLPVSGRFSEKLPA